MFELIPAPLSGRCEKYVSFACDYTAGMNAAHRVLQMTVSSLRQHTCRLCCSLDWVPIASMLPQEGGPLILTLDNSCLGSCFTVNTVPQVELEMSFISFLNLSLKPSVVAVCTVV